MLLDPNNQAAEKGAERVSVKEQEQGAEKRMCAIYLREELCLSQ